MSNDVLKTLEKLPPIAYTVLNTDPTALIKIRRGVIGYYPIAHREDARRFADFANERLGGVTGAQLAAMEAGSIFGWEIPAADPDTYNEDGSLKKRAA